MKSKRMSVREAQANLDQVIEEVRRTRRPVVIEAGDDEVAIVPLRVLQIYEEDRAAFFDEWRAIAERVNLSPEEADAIVNEAIAEVRAEKRIRRAS